jgi:hypothetical protein
LLNKTAITNHALIQEMHFKQKDTKLGISRWLTPAILAAWEAEIRSIPV